MYSKNNNNQQSTKPETRNQNHAIPSNNYGLLNHPKVILDQEKYEYLTKI